jgi:hypothetical protein
MMARPQKGLAGPNLENWARYRSESAPAAWHLIPAKHLRAESRWSLTPTWQRCYCFLFYYFIYFFVVLRIEPRALHVLGKWSTDKLHSQPIDLILNG